MNITRDQAFRERRATRSASSTKEGGGLESHRELDVTREKLHALEARYEADKREHGGDEHVREISMRSLKRLINQLKEEIARYESRVAQKTTSY